MNSPFILLAGVAYLASVFINADLKDGHRVRTSAALAPGIIALSQWGYGDLDWRIGIAVIGGAECMGLLLRRRALGEVGGHLILAGLCVGLFAGAAALYVGNGASRGATALIASLGSAGGLVFGLLDALARTRRQHALSGEFRAAMLAHVVNASVAGLVVLAYDILGPVAFGVMLFPLYVTQQEFKRWSDTRRTYFQTIRALGRLTELSGYVPQGHHDSVATIAVKLGRAIGLESERLESLRLLALVHDVGLVTLADARDPRTTDRQLVADAGARILEETGYLAPQASLLRDIDGTSSTEAVLLRVAESLDLDLREGRRAVAIERAIGKHPHFSEVRHVLEAQGARLLNEIGATR